MNTAADRPQRHLDPSLRSRAGALALAFVATFGTLASVHGLATQHGDELRLAQQRQSQPTQVVVIEARRLAHS